MNLAIRSTNVCETDVQRHPDDTHQFMMYTGDGHPIDISIVAGDTDYNYFHQAQKADWELSFSRGRGTYITEALASILTKAGYKVKKKQGGHRHETLSNSFRPTKRKLQTH